MSLSQAALAALLVSLAAITACRTAPDDEVWLDRAPHLLNAGWRIAAPGERGVVVTAPRAVIQFFLPSARSVGVRLRGWPLPGQRVDPLIRVSANGGCEVGPWRPSQSHAGAPLVLSESCARAGVNLLEFEAELGDATETFALETLALEGVAGSPEPLFEPVRLGLQTRIGVVSDRLAITLPLDPEGESDLVTALGLSGQGWGRSVAGVEARVVLRSAGMDDVVLAERIVGRGGEGAGSWETLRADLSALAGRRASLEFTRRTVPGPRGEASRLPIYADPAQFLTLEEPRLMPKRPRPDDPPPVILVVFDTLRADHLPVYGYGRETAPHLTALAREGITFRTCLAPSPWTLPSVASLLTGLYPGQHFAGLRRPLPDSLDAGEDLASVLPPFRTFRYLTRLAPDVITLAQRLGGAGYLAAGFIENTYLSDRSGLARGFIQYLWANDLRPEVENPISRRRFFQSDLPAREWIENHSTRPVFLYRHYIAPHLPYMAIPGEERFVRAEDAPELGHYFEDEKGAYDARYGPAARRRIVDLYDETIHLADRRFGDLIAALKESGLYDRALIIVTSDHGEEFWDHEGYGHGHALYDEVLRVPLIVKLPHGRHAGRIESAPARLIDIVPTVLAEAGLAVPADLPGKRLRLGSGNEAEAAPFESFAEAVLYGPPRRMARRDSLVMILTEPRPERLVFGDRPVAAHRPLEIFDVRADPPQRNDLGGSRGDLTASLRAFLEEGFRRIHRPLPADARGLELSEEEIEQLESLGYVAAP